MTAGQPPQINKNRETLDGLAREFEMRQREAVRAARRASRLAPVLAVVSAAGSAFAGAAVATTDLSAAWRTVVIVVAFVATGVGAGAAALRPTERAQAAKVDAANASALLTWLDVLRLEEPQLAPRDFTLRVQALRAWYVRQLGSEPYTYDGATPWLAPGSTIQTLPQGSTAQPMPTGSTT
jgi:hypothetical protein